MFRLRPYAFPLVFATILVLFQAGITLLLHRSGAPDNIWLGNTIINSGDQAVYLSNIEQVRRGAIFQRNLYGPEPQIPFVHPFYVPLGLLARWANLPSVQAHEIGRWFATFCAVFLLHAVSRRLTKNERDASILTIGTVLVGGVGWVVNISRASFGMTLGDAIPDIETEAFLFPMLLGGAHIPLVWALLPYVLMRAWENIYTKTSWKQRTLDLGATFLLGLIHPYSLLTVGIFLLIVVFMNVEKSRRFPLAISWLYALVCVFSTLPHILSHLLSPSRRFLLVANDLPIQPWFVWLFACLPFLILLGWRVIRKDALQPHERWLAYWLIAIAIGIALPFKWDRKLTEGLSALLIWLSAPTIFWMRDRLRGEPFLAGALCMLLFLTPIGLARAQIDYAIQGSNMGNVLYFSKDIMQAFRWIDEHTPKNAVLLTEDAWLGTWAPTYTQHHVWAGHKHETPDWQRKYDLLKRVVTDMPVNEVRDTLDREGITIVLNTEKELAERWDTIFENTSWHVVATFDDVRVFGGE
ncbi:MAG: hypothetical protein WCV84_04160 [Patescibacteria group bacterium]